MSEKGPFFYPDVVVSCDERDRKAKDMVRHPCLIVEVLSPCTEAFDRGKKFRQYRCLSSLKEYVLISAEAMMVEAFRLNEQGKWELTFYSLDSLDTTVVEAHDVESNGHEIGENERNMAEDLTVELTSVGYQGAIALIYEDVELSQAEGLELPQV